MTSPNPNDILFGTSTPGVKFESPGDTVTGSIVKLGASQQTHYTTKDPLTWPDGKPRMQVEVSIQTTLRDPSIEDDDGIRRLFVKGKILTNAVKDAVRGAGAKGLELGGVLTVTYIGNGPAEKGLNPPKLYEAEYVRANPAAAANAALGLADAVATAATTPAATFTAPATTPQQDLTTPAGPDLSGLDPAARAVIEQMLANQAGAKQ